MKRNNYFFILIFPICAFCGCSDESSEISSNSTTSSTSKVIADNDTSVYISPKMAKILKMIDTCQTAIPIENLISPIKDTETSNNLKTRTTGTYDDSDGSYVITGYTNSILLYSDVKTTISEAQESSFNMPAGTYYIACFAVTQDVSFKNETTLVSAYKYGDMMGIQPDSLNAFGYSVQEKYAKRNYRLTTYLWGLASVKSSDDGYTYNLYQNIPNTSNDASTEVLLSDFLNEIQWRFFAY